MDERLRQYLLEKYPEQLSGINTAQAFANLGDVIAGQKVGSQNPFYTEQRQLAEQQTLGEVARQDAMDLRKQQAQEALALRMAQLQQAQQNAQENRDLKKMMMGQKLEQQRATAQQKEEKKSEADEVLNIPDFERVQGVKVKPDEAARLRKAKGEFDSLNQNLREYRDHVKNYGNFEYFGKAGGQMGSLANSVRMNLKNLYELGALAGPDMALLETQITNPDQLKNLLTSNKTAEASLEETQKTLERNFLNKMAASGYKQQGQNVPQKAAPSERVPVKKFQNKELNKTKIVYSDGTEEVIDGLK